MHLGLVRHQPIYADKFISLLKLMVVPLVFFSLTSGVSSLDKNLSLGRIAGKTLGLYLITTAIAISIGLSIAVFLNPGNNLDLQTSTLISIPERPNIKDIILHRQVLTPADLESTFSLTEGNIFHGELTLQQLFAMRPAVKWANYTTPIKNYYQCGSGTHPGGGVTGSPGEMAAKRILKVI